MPCPHMTSLSSRSTRGRVRRPKNQSPKVEETTTHSPICQCGLYVPRDGDTLLSSEMRRKREYRPSSNKMYHELWHTMMFSLNVNHLNMLGDRKYFDHSSHTTTWPTWKAKETIKKPSSDHHKDSQSVMMCDVMLLLPPFFPVRCSPLRRIVLDNPIDAQEVQSPGGCITGQKDAPRDLQKISDITCTFLLW